MFQGISPDFQKVDSIVGSLPRWRQGLGVTAILAIIVSRQARTVPMLSD